MLTDEKNSVIFHRQTVKKRGNLIYGNEWAQ